MKPRMAERDEKGQVLALFAFTITAVLLTIGLVIDGGNGLTQRRDSQNAADFAALAGARIVAESIGGDTVNGTDSNVKNAIIRSTSSNGVNSMTFGSGTGPIYVDDGGHEAGWVGAGHIPDDAVGVRVTTNKTFNTYFLGIAGMSSLNAGATATARGGFATGAPQGSLFPAGIALAFFQTYPSAWATLDPARAASRST